MVLAAQVQLPGRRDRHPQNGGRADEGASPCRKPRPTKIQTAHLPASAVPAFPPAGTCRRGCFPPPFGRHTAQVRLQRHSSVGGQGQTPLAAEGEGSCREPALGPECGHRALARSFLALGLWEGRLVVNHHISSPERTVLSGGGWGAAFPWELIVLFARPHLSRGRPRGLEDEYSWSSLMPAGTFTGAGGREVRRRE